MPFFANRKGGSHYGQNRPYWHISNTLRRLDSFGIDISSFNLKGATSVQTLLVGIMTTLIAIISLTFAFVRMS